MDENINEEKPLFLKENLSSHFAAEVVYVLLKHGVEKKFNVRPIHKDLAKLAVRDATGLMLREITDILQDEEYKVFPAYEGILVSTK